MQAILAIHIAAGTLGVLAGAAALGLSKGAKWHRRAGTVFTIAMVVLALTAAVLGRDFANIVAGGMTTYFVITAWMAARRKDNQTGKFEMAAFAIAIVCGLGMAASAVLIAFGSEKPQNPYIIPVALTISGVLVLAALGDLRVILRGGIAGAQRKARHLWRMCFGLLIAVGSFVTQGAEALPPAFRGPEVLFSSMALVVVVMLYWLARVLTKGWSAPAEVQVTRSKTMALALVTALFLTGADTPSFFDRLQGRWEGTGAAFGGPSKIDAEWQWALGGKFFRLDLRYEIRNADGSTGEFAGHAYYARKGPNTFEGQWFDSQGNQYPITATLAGDVLTAHWGIPGKVEGRSIYGLSTGGRVFEINDAMRRKDGTWRDFAAFKLQRAPSDGKTQG